MLWYKYFNYGSIIFILILLVLVLTETIPKTWYVPILILTIVIFILRIVARLFFTMKTKKQN